MAGSNSRHVEAVLGAVHSPTSAAVSPLAASWCRSALRHGLDPARPPRREAVDAATLADLRAEQQALLAVAQPVLDQVFRAVGRSGCGVVLSNAAGVILERRIGAGDAADFDAVGLIEGGRWSEAEEGTNGIGTCLVEDRPVVIHRDQHFASHNTGISCMDAPVHDPHGQLVAALDVSSCRADHGPAMAEMIVALIADAARRIERDLFCRHFAAARVVLVGDDPSGTALLAADRDGLVIGASRAARLRLGIGDETLARPRPIDLVMGAEETLSFEEGDRTVLRRALARANGNVSAAARLLGIGRATLYRRLARAGLVEDRFSAPDLSQS